LLECHAGPLVAVEELPETGWSPSIFSNVSLMDTPDAVFRSRENITAEDADTPVERYIGLGECVDGRLWKFVAIFGASFELVALDEFLVDRRGG
jgi:hypothetical protein